MDAAEAMNHIARAVEEAMGDPVNSQEGAPPRGPWLPLSVRYGAAEAAAKVVVAWKQEGLLYGGDGSGLDAACEAQEPFYDLDNQTIVLVCEEPGCGAAQEGTVEGPWCALHALGRAEGSHD